MDASLFPRDASLLAAQGKVILWDGLAAGLTSVLHLPLPWTFFLLFTAGMLLLYAGALLIARGAGLSGWGTIAFLALLTLRHRIAKTGVNTLEGYLHPRMIAFGLGAIAIGAFLRRRPGWAAAAIGAAAAVHPTTGVWFALLLGVAALVALRYALAVQLQIPRVFWLVELTAFVVLCLALSRARPRTAAIVAAVLVVASAARGATVLFVEKDGRPVTIDLPRDDWTGAMAWLRAQPAGAHVLADPGHAWRYGSSVRVAAERDVFHEDVKDAAVAMYDRPLALRVVERRARTADFASKTARELQALAREFDLDYLVTDQRVDLPLRFENATFRIYDLRTSNSELRTR